MIAKKFRLHKKKDFDQILKSPYKFYSNNFVLRFIKTKKETNCFAIVISAKISKKAVERNKIRRRIYEIIRLNLEQIKKSYNLVFFVKKGVLALKYQDTEKEILYLLKKAKLLIRH